MAALYIFADLLGCSEVATKVQRFRFVFRFSTRVSLHTKMQ